MERKEFLRYTGAMLLFPFIGNANMIINSDEITKEVFILQTDVVNRKLRKYSKQLVEEWFSLLKVKGKLNVYSMEESKKLYNGTYSLTKNDVNIDSTPVIGHITKLTLKDDLLYGNFTYKQSDPYIKKFIENLKEDSIISLPPLGTGFIRGEEIFDYKLLGFSLVPIENSTYNRPTI